MSSRTPRIHRTPCFELECGAVLSDVRQAYFLDGELDVRRENLVIVFHALTGSADALGEWWPGVVGPGMAIDTDRFAVLCPNLLGSCYGTGARWEGDGPFPAVTTRDQARLVHALVAELGVDSVRLVVGGSLGGMVALEWAATFPGLTRGAVALAAPAAHPAPAIGWSHVQRRIIAAAGEEGLEIARMIAMMTYRTAREMESRFGREREATGEWSVESYLSHHGRKLRDRFDVQSYLTLLGAMDSHDVGRGRGGVAAALRGAGTRLVGAGVVGDLLYSDADVRRWVEAAGGRYEEIRSVHGHDAFLLEAAQVSAILRRALDADHPAVVSTPIPQAR